MHVPRWAIGFLFVTALVTSAVAQPPEPSEAAPPAAAAETPKVPSADYLGPAVYDLQVVGTVQDALRDLERVTGWHFLLVGKGAGRVAGNEPVALDFTKATLDAILLALCEQAGLVYDVPMGGKYVQLRAGDPKQDPRPSVVVGDYVVRVTDVRVSTQRSFSLRWGVPFTGEPDGYENLSIGLTICPRTVEAQLQLGGVLPSAKATTEKGATLETPATARGGFFYSSRFAQFRPDVVVPLTGQVQLPVPGDGSLSLTRLEGSLLILPEAKAVTLDLTAESKGKTVDLGTDKLVLEEWSQQGPDLQITLRRLPPPNPAAPAGDAKIRLQEVWQRAVAVTKVTGPDQAQVVAIGKDGQEHPAQTTSLSGAPDGSWKMQYGFQKVGEVATVRYTSVVRGGTEKELPFVIENIPLP